MPSAAPTPPFILQPCTQADIPSMVEVYLQAFENNTINQIWAPTATVSNASLTTWLTARFSKALQKPEMVLTKVVDTSTGQIAAWSRWSHPFTLTEEEQAVRKVESDEQEVLGEKWPEGANEEVAEKFFGALDEMRERYGNVSRNYVCGLLATSPSYQRKGLGKMLLKHSLDLADAEGKVAYIEATPAGHELYLKMGWRDVDRIEIDLSKWGEETMGVNWVMLREPQAIKEGEV